jgi:ubiquinone/menaquinone biosynthesis C-methylase UbiE
MDYMAGNGRADHPSRAALADLIRTAYPTDTCDLLDCGVLSGVTYRQLREAGLPVRYTGVDISQSIVNHCRALHPEGRWEQMSAMDLAFAANSFDVVNCRHLLEHLPYYETAVREIFRVSRHHVVISLFQRPRDPEILLRRETANGYIWLNRYAPGPFEALLRSLSESVEATDIAADYKVDRVYLCVKRSANP